MHSGDGETSYYEKCTSTSWSATKDTDFTLSVHSPISVDEPSGDVHARVARFYCERDDLRTVMVEYAPWDPRDKEGEVAPQARRRHAPCAQVRALPVGRRLGLPRA